MPGTALAHDQSSSYVTLNVTPERLEADVAFRPSDFGRGFGGDPDGNGRIDPGELRAVTPRLFQYLGENLHLVADFQELELAPVEGRLDRDEQGRQLIVFRLNAPLRRLPAEVAVTADFAEPLGTEHLNLVELEAGKRSHQAVLTHDDPRVVLAVGGERSLLRQAGQFVWLGVEHIFLGYDHILFLLALIVVGGRLRDLIKIVTAFTVAHSITLVLAALKLVSLPSQLIESGIALSIVYVALENFWIRKADHRWILTFFFGLVHGFGFANVLSELGLPSEGLVSSLLAFNVGVELGQICIVALLFPLTLWLARQPFRKAVVGVISAVILVAGLGWFIERVFGLSYMPI